MNLRINAESSSAIIANTEESLESGGDTRENADTHAYAFSEVATLNGSGDDFLFKQQDQVRYFFFINIFVYIIC